MYRRKSKLNDRDVKCRVASLPSEESLQSGKKFENFLSGWPASLLV